MVPVVAPPVPVVEVDEEVVVEVEPEAVVLDEVVNGTPPPLVNEVWVELDEWLWWW